MRLTNFYALLIFLCSSLTVPFAFGRLPIFVIQLFLLLTVPLAVSAELSSRTTRLVLLIRALTGTSILLVSRQL